MSHHDAPHARKPQVFKRLGQGVILAMGITAWIAVAAGAVALTIGVVWFIDLAKACSEGPCL